MKIKILISIVITVFTSIIILLSSSTTAEIIETNTWDRLDEPGWSITTGGSGERPTIDSSTNTPDPANALRFLYPQGCPFSPPSSCGPGKMTYYLPSDLEEFYYGHWFKFQENFQMHPVRTKLNYVFNNYGVNGFTGNWIVGVASSWKITFTNQIIWGIGTKDYHSNTGYDPTIQRNHWYWIEVYAKMNTPGQEDGVIKVWLDDQLVMDHTNIPYRSADEADAYFGRLQHNPIWGGVSEEQVQNDQYLWMDYTVVSTTRIGMPGSPPTQYCDDGTCDSGECDTCPQDCTLAQCCGDGTCQSAVGETCSTCFQDCCTSPKICCSDQCILPICSQDPDCGTDPCKTYTCNNPGTCTASCSSIDITSCINNDNCCPSSCTSTNDNDCIEGEITEIWGESSDSDYPGTVEDTYININNINYASETLLKTYTWPVDQIANAILIKWDLSALPVDANVIDADLYLYMSGAGGDSLYTNSVHKIINYNPVITQTTGNTYDGVNGWTPNACCDGFPMAQADISTAESSQETNTTIEYKTWAVTQMVNDWVSNPESNYGMLINSDAVASSNSYRYFVSTENSNANQRPKLVITYSISGSLCSQADTNLDDVVSMVELMSYIADWKAGSVTMVNLMTAIGEWKNGC